MNSFGHEAAYFATFVLMAAGLVIAATAGASAADLGNTSPVLGSLAAPLVRYDAYGYPVYAATAVHVTAPIYTSPGCPVGFQPVYDANGNFAGYGPIRICQ